MKNKTLILISGLVLIVGLLIGFSITTIIIDSKPPQLGTIYLKFSEIEYAPGLKENIGANVVIMGVLGETINDIIPEGNVEDII